MPVTSSQRSGGDHGLTQFTPHVAPHCAAATAVMSAPRVFAGALPLGNQFSTAMRLTKNCSVVLFVVTVTVCEPVPGGCVIAICAFGMVTNCCAPMASDLWAWPT